MIEEWCKITCIKRLRNYEISSFGNVRHCKTHQQRRNERCWMHNGNDTTLVYIEDIDKYLLLGYTLGRGKLKQGGKQV